MNKTSVCSTTIFTNKLGWLILAAITILTAYYHLIWLFFVFILFLSYLIWSYFWTVQSCRSLTVNDSFNDESIFAGDTITLEYRLQNKSAFPLAHCGLRFYLPAAFFCSSDDSLKLVKVVNTQRDEIVSLQGILNATWILGDVQRDWISEKKAGSITITINAPLRGYYYLPPAQVFAGDPSGLYQGFNQVGKGHYLTVMPKLKENADLHKILSFEETHKEDIFGLDDPYQALGVRDYQSSDSPKNINWYASARTQAIKTNLYQRKISASCLVVFDLSCGMELSAEPQSEREEDPILEDAISLACGIALSQLERGAETAFYTNAPILYWDKSYQKNTAWQSQCHTEKKKRSYRSSFWDRSRSRTKYSQALRCHR